VDQRNIQPIADLSESDRRSLGVPDDDPILTPEGFAMWEGEELPVELPTNAWGLTSHSSATGIGLGRVQIALAYRRTNGTDLTVALEESDDGPRLLGAEAADVREANAQLLSVMADWAFCGWETTCRLAGADEMPHIAADGAAPISIADRRSRRDSAA
jgi:hypothetical protein